MRWTWEMAPRVERAFGKLDRPVRVRVVDALDRLVEALGEGIERPMAITEMQGAVGTWRLRVGDYRVVFERLTRAATPAAEKPPAEATGEVPPEPLGTAQEATEGDQADDLIGVVAVIRVGPRGEVYDK